MRFLNQRGFTPIIFFLGIALVSAGIIGGSIYIKVNHPILINKTNKDNENLLVQQNQLGDSNVGSDKTNRAFDDVIKHDLKNIYAKSVICQAKLNGDKFPLDLYQYNKECGPQTFPINHNTGKLHYYKVTNNGDGFIFKAKLSTGEIYTVTEENYEDPEPTLPQQSADSVKKLKRYENEAYRYSIELASDWVTDTTSFSRLSTVRIYPPHSGGSGEENFGTTLLIRVFDDNDSSYPMKTKEEFDLWFAANKPSDDKKDLSKIGNITIDSNPAVQFTRRGFRGDGTEPWFSKVTWVRKSNLNYYIEFLGKEERVKRLIPSYDEVLKTFKFI